jgi:predicted nucleic acid-binding protein
MYCLDTNIIINLFRGDESLRSKIEECQSFSIDIFITPATLCELYKGAYLSNDIQKNIRDIKNFILSFVVLDFNDNTCEEFGKEFARLRKLGKTPPETDLMIASIVKANNLILVTKNKKDFAGMKIKVEEW